MSLRYLLAGLFCIYLVQPWPLLASSPHHINIGGEGFYRDYHEKLTPPFQSDEYGWLPALYLGYDFIAEQQVYAGLDYRETRGHTVYNGSLQNIVSGRFAGLWQDMTHNEIRDIDARLGYNFKYQDQHHVIPYLFYGYHQWLRVIGFSSTTLELYQWNKIGLGLLYFWDFDNAWQLSLKAQTNTIENAHMYAPGYEKFSLADEQGFDLELLLRYSFLKHRLHLKGGPFYRSQPIGQSPLTCKLDHTNCDTYEPESNTHIYGGRFSVELQF